MYKILFIQIDYLNKQNKSVNSVYDDIQIMLIWFIRIDMDRLTIFIIWVDLDFEKDSKTFYTE